MNYRARTWIRVLACGLAGAAVLTGGCGPAPVPGKTTPSLQDTHKVIAKDFKLHDWMRVVHHKAERTSADLLRVKLGIENVEDHDVWCDIQVIFYDADRFELEKTNWQPLLLRGEQNTYYSTSSLSSRAADYTVFLKKPREAKGIE